MLNTANQRTLLMRLKSCARWSSNQKTAGTPVDLLNNNVEQSSILNKASRKTNWILPTQNDLAYAAKFAFGGIRNLLG